MTRFRGDSIGERIRLLRNDMGWTQTELRAQMKARTGNEFSQGYLSEVERGKKTPGGELLDALASTLETNVDYILCRTDDYRPLHERTQSYWSEEADKVARMVDMLSQPRRDEVVVVVSALLAAQRRDQLDANNRQLESVMHILYDRLSADVADSILEEIRRRFDGSNAANNHTASK